MKINYIKLAVSFLMALIITVSASAVSFETKCDDLRNNILRLHILANSDSKADQELKLKVRDAVLDADFAEFNACTNLEQAKSAAQNSITEITQIANDVIRENGYNYNVEVRIDKSYFDTRVYDNFTLPAGIYDALIIEIGEAKGKNWWCVMFPALCIPAATDKTLTDSVSEESAQIAINAEQYEIRFKSVEIYQHIKKILSKR